ncbi:hypothetical protein VTG60DRAFT_6889 [Thermothelomyces hinnuleus]
MMERKTKSSGTGVTAHSSMSTPSTQSCESDNQPPEAPDETHNSEEEDATPDAIHLLQTLVAEVKELNANLRDIRGLNSREQPLRQPGPQIFPQQQNADGGPVRGDGAHVLVAQLGHPVQPEQEQLAMLDEFPAADLMLVMRQDLENAVGPCGCRIGGEPVSIFSMNEYPPATHAVHWTFRNAILVLTVPPDTAPSGILRLALHCPNRIPTAAESAACRRYIRDQWPSEVVRASWKRYPVPLEADPEEDRCPFWGFENSTLHSTFVHQLYACSTVAGLQLQPPRMSYRLDEGVRSVRYQRVDHGGSTATGRPGEPGYVSIGQIWSITLGKVVLDLKSAALILSLCVLSHLSAWQLAREWVLEPFRLRLGGGPPTAMIHFTMRWLCPCDELPGFFGFLLCRETGVLPKSDGRPGISVREGRVSVRFISSCTVPPVFSAVIIQDFAVGRSNLGPKLLGGKPHRLHVFGESSISVLQLVLLNILENAWYTAWTGLLDEIDDCVKVQPADILNANAAEKLMLDDTLADSRRYDLEKLRNDCNVAILTTVPGPNPQPLLQTAGLVYHNWDAILARFHVLEDELHRRIEAKTDEIRGLRDGLFNASSLMEAHKATSMNRWITIFTTITIFYLPPGFITSFFSMDLLHERDLGGLKQWYIVSIVLVSVVTYGIAFSFILWLSGDRQKFVASLVEYFQNIVPSFLVPSNKRTSSTPTEITEEDWQKFGQSGPWSGFLAAPPPPSWRERRRMKKRKKDEGTES